MPVTYIDTRGRIVDAHGNVHGRVGDSDPEEPAFDPAAADDSQLDRLKKADLLAVAEYREIDLGDASTNAEIIEAIKAASSEQSGDGDNAPPDDAGGDSTE